MRTKASSLPSASMVVSVVALVVALGGTGYATTHLHDTRDSRPTAAQTKVFKELAKKITVANALNAKKLAHLPASAYLQKSHLIFGSITPGADPKIAHGRGVVAVKNLDTGPNAGFYRVTFDRKVTNCTWIATAGPVGNSDADFNVADVRGTTEPNAVIVIIYDDTGDVEDPGQGFHILVACP